MAYPTVNFRHVQGAIGMQPINETSATQKHPIGLLVQGRDETYGDGEFIYLKGVASTAAGDLVCYLSSTGATVRAVIAGSGSSGPCAVAMSANVANQYGWYQVSGAGPVKSATVLANTSLYLTATAGSVDDAVSANNQVSGIVIKAADSGGYATCQLARPSVVGLGGTTGANTGDVTLAAVGAVPSDNGASLSGQVLTLQPADATHPGLVTTGAQSIAGAKTFSGAVVFGSTATRAPTDRALAVYTTAAGQSFTDEGADQLVVFGTSVTDEASAVTTNGSSTWVYTCPAAGFYDVRACVMWANLAAATSLDAALYLYKNDALVYQIARFGFLDPVGGGTGAMMGTAPLISCAASDTLKIYLTQNNEAGDSALVLLTDARLNWVSIHKAF
jgi:hypothetical protein